MAITPALVFPLLDEAAVVALPPAKLLKSEPLEPVPVAVALAVVVDVEVILYRVGSVAPHGWLVRQAAWQAVAPRQALTH